MQETIKDLKERRSCRSFRAEQVREEELKQILEAGIYAPSARGAQSAIIIVVQDQETIGKLSELNAAVIGKPELDPFYGAPTVAIVLADKSYPTRVYDGSVVMANMLNAAHAMGVGSCWIHRAKEMFESEEGKELLEKWGVEGEYEGVGNCILGYAEKEGKAAPRKENYIYRV